MDFEEKELIRKTLSLAEENNKILRKMQSSMRWGRILRVFYWVLIIAISVGSFYFIQPYLDHLVSVYSGFSSDLQNVNSLISPR